MSKFNAFRPMINALEDRSMMSVSPFSIATENPTEHATWDLVANKGAISAGESTELRYELENVLITSYQTGGHEGLTKVGTGTLTLAGESTAVGSSGMSAGKVSYSDLSVMISLENARVDDVIIAGDQPQTASHKETIEIQSWSFGASNPSAAVEITKVGTGTLEFHGVQLEAAGSHALYQDVTIPSSTGFYRPTGDGIDDLANNPDNGVTGKAVLHVRKSGSDPEGY